MKWRRRSVIGRFYRWRGVMEPSSLTRSASGGCPVPSSTSGYSTDLVCLRSGPNETFTPRSLWLIYSVTHHPWFDFTVDHPVPTSLGAPIAIRFRRSTVTETLLWLSVTHVALLPLTPSRRRTDTRYLSDVENWVRASLLHQNFVGAYDCLTEDIEIQEFYWVEPPTHTKTNKTNWVYRTFWVCRRHQSQDRHGLDLLGPSNLKVSQPFATYHSSFLSYYSCHSPWSPFHETTPTLTKSRARRRERVLSDTGLIPLLLACTTFSPTRLKCSKGVSWDRSLSFNRRRNTFTVPTRPCHVKEPLHSRHRRISIVRSLTTHNANVSFLVLTLVGSEIASSGSYR